MVASLQRRLVGRLVNSRQVASRVLIAGAAAVALVSASGFAKAAPSGEQASLARSATVRDLVGSIDGEWEGSVQVHTGAAGEARNSASVVGLSASVSSATCSAVFAGAAFGKPFDGALVWNASDNSASWVVGDSKQAVRASLVSSAPGVLTFASAPEAIAGSKESRMERFEQVVRLDQEGHVKIELSRVVSGAQGEQRERIASLDVVKLPAGEPSLASGLAGSSAQLALAQRANGQVDQRGDASRGTATASAAE